LLSKERFEGEGDLVLARVDLALFGSAVNLLSQDEDRAAAVRMTAFFSSV
jgi:hypothetical protein